MNSRLRRPAVALITTTLAASVLGIAPAAQAADGTVSGTVSSAEGPLENLRVDLYEYESYGGGGYWRQTDYTDQTNPEGGYSMSVPEGEYRVRFDNYDADYAFEFYEDADTVEEADTVTVPSAAAGQVDAVLSAAAHISGEVTDPDGDPLEDALVSAYQVVGTGSDADYRFVGFATTVSGAYDIGGLAGGTYVIEFEDVFGSDTPTYATEYFNNQPNEYVAERITLADGGTRDEVDAQLELDSEISGAVTGDNGGTVDYGYATALVAVGDEWLEVGYGEVQSDGTYVIDGLAADTYRVRFGAEVGGRYLEEYWDNQGDVSTATDVVLDVDDSEPSINAVLIEGEHEPVYPFVENLTAPVISGTPRVGSPLTSSAGTWSPNPTLVEYYFVAGEQLLQGGTSPTYVPTAADLGKTIEVYVYASADGYDYGYSYAVSSGPVVAAAPPAPPVTTTPVPVVDVPAGLAAIVAGLDTSGKPKVGKTVKVSGLDMLLRTTVSYKFQWFAGTKKIKKATKSKLKITRAMKGKKISVKVTATAASTSKSVKLKVGKVK